MKKIRYTWIGSPRFNLAKQDPYHKMDVSGPEQMAFALVAADSAWRVVFYCQNKHVAAYRKYFSGGANEAAGDVIDVLGIEDTLLDLVEAGNPLDQFVSALMRGAMRDSAPVCEWVNAKNLWSLFTLWKCGGYHLDTGVAPLKGFAGLPEPGRFMVPGNPGSTVEMNQLGHWEIHQKFGLPVAPTDSILVTMGIANEEVLGLNGLERHAKLLVPHIDVWCLYSDAQDQQAHRALYCQVYLMMAIKPFLTNLALYKDLCGHVIVSAVQNGLGQTAAARTAHMWDARTSGSDSDGVPELKLIKRYFNSHR